jgi:ankyrin repeat protein
LPRVMTLEDATRHAAVDLLDVHGAIAEQADRAVAEAERSSHGLGDDETFARLLRRLVRRQDSGNRLQLSTCRVPTDVATLHLVQALLRRRLLIQEGPDRVRLVHESVLTHWKKGADWLEAERRPLRLARLIEPRAVDWAREGRMEKALEGLGFLELDEAAELLYRWSDVFHHADPADVDPMDGLLKEYCLARLRANPRPTRPVAGRKTHGNHWMIAVEYGDVGLIETYLAMDKRHVDLTRSDGRDAMFFVEAGPATSKVFGLLRAAGARFDRPDKDGWQPVHAAANSGNAEVITLLLAEGAGADAPGKAGTPPLALAAGKGHREVCRLLVASPGCDPGWSGEDGWSALHCACRNGHARLVEELLTLPRVDPTTPVKDGWGPLHLAVWSGSAEVTGALLADPRVDPSAPGPAQVRPLHLAVKEDEAEIVERLLGHPRCDPNAPDERQATALHRAVEKGHRRMVERLLRHAATDPMAPDTDDVTPLGLANGLKRDEILGVLLEDRRVAPDRVEKGGWTPLLMAARANRMDVVRRFLERADVSPAGQGDDGSTLLHLVLNHDEEELAMTLIDDERIESWTPDERGETPLHLAVRRGLVRVIDQLLNDRTVSHDVVRANSSALAHAARWTSHLPLLDRLLLDGRLDANAGDNRGLTALHYAVFCGNEEAVVRLRAHPGIEVQPRDIWGRVPIDFAPVVSRERLRAILAPAP